MTRLLTSTFALALLAAPAFAAGAQPKSVAVRPTLVAPEIVITAYREKPQRQTASATTSTKREKDDRVVAASDRPRRSAY